MKNHLGSKWDFLQNAFVGVFPFTWKALDRSEGTWSSQGWELFYYFYSSSSSLQSSFKCQGLSQNNSGFKAAKGQLESERYSLQITLKNDTCYERGLLFGVLKRYQKSNCIVRLWRQAVGDCVKLPELLFRFCRCLFAFHRHLQWDIRQDWKGQKSCGCFENLFC